MIYKDHIMPCKQHFDIINKINKPVLILLRNSKDAAGAYKRLQYSYDREKTKEAKSYLKKWIDIYKKINKKQLIKDFQKYYDEWLNAKLGCALYIYFEDLIKDYNNIMVKILKHFKLKIPENIDQYKLLKGIGTHGQQTYTGYGEKKIKELL